MKQVFRGGLQETRMSRIWMSPAWPSLSLLEPDETTTPSLHPPTPRPQDWKPLHLCFLQSWVGGTSPFPAGAWLS